MKDLLFWLYDNLSLDHHRCPQWNYLLYLKKKWQNNIVNLVGNESLFINIFFLSARLAIVRIEE